MEIIFRMAVRNMLPETINKAARMFGRSISAEEHSNIHLKKVVEWDAVPEVDSDISVHPEADPRTVKSVTWSVNGVVEIWLEDLDTDEIADEEGVVVEELLDSQWELDID